MSVAEIIKSRRQAVVANNIVDMSFVLKWSSQKSLWQSLRFLGVSCPLNSWFCQKGFRPVVWNGTMVEVPDGFTLYEVTHRVEELGGYFVVKKPDSLNPENDRDLVSHICGIVKRPADMLVRSGYSWKLLVASNGEQGLVIECQFPEETKI